MGVITALLVTLLAACGGDDEPEPTPSPAPPTAVAPASPAATPEDTATSRPTGPDSAPPRPAATFPPGASQLISDGICQGRIPNSWADNGTGRGTTLSGARFVLFGGRLANDGAWDQAVELAIQAAPADAAIEEGEGFVHITFPDDGGFEYRGRFGALYCDVTVTSRRGPIAEEERATWDAVIGSLDPVS